MKACAVLALLSVLIWGNTPALAEQPRATSSKMDILVRNVFETCSNIAAKAKDIKVFNYCVAEMLRPLLQGRACIAFVAAAPQDPGYHCDTEGMMYYDALEDTPTRSMAKDEISDAVSKVLSKQAEKWSASCVVTGKSDDDKVACLIKGKQKFFEAAEKCSDIKFEVKTDEQMVRALDHCIEYKMRL
jgi:hypothetical protein